MVKLKQYWKNIFTFHITLEWILSVFAAIVFLSMIYYNWSYVQTESRLVFHGLTALFILMFINVHRIRPGYKILLAGGTLYPLILTIGFSLAGG